MSSTLHPDPWSHPDNANLPTVNRPATILSVTITLAAIAAIAVSLRLWVRWRNRLWGFDDCLVLLAAMASFAGDTLICQMPRAGLGLHLWTLDHSHRAGYFKFVYSTNVSYCASSAFIKLSILFQYLRLFAESASASNMAQYRFAHRLTWSLIIAVTLWGLTFWLLAIFPCFPIAKNWNTKLQGRCVGWGSKDPSLFFSMYLGHSVSNTMLDLLVLVLPVPFLRMLRLAGKSRVAIVSLFGLGCLIGALAMGRMITMSINRVGTIPIPDMTFHIAIVYIFGVSEVNIAIAAASIPIFWPIIVTLAANKIFVVNEIEVVVERVSGDTYGTGKALDKGEGQNILREQSGRMMTITKKFDCRPSKSSHGHKSSTTSSLGRALGHRPSQDSQRYLYRAASNDLGSARSLSRNEGNDWISDMNKMSHGTTTTTVQRTDIPLEQMKAFDQR